MKVTSEALKRLGVSFVRESSGIAEYTLTSNGLKILFLEHHLAPVVTTTIMYRVGSRNEGVGFTGSTHFLEHMMFKGTKNHKVGDFSQIYPLARGVAPLLVAIASVTIRSAHTTRPSITPLASLVSEPKERSTTAVPGEAIVPVLIRR